jgi:hypothetical protein
MTESQASGGANGEDSISAQIQHGPTSAWRIKATNQAYWLLDEISTIQNGLDDNSAKELGLTKDEVLKQLALVRANLVEALKVSTTAPRRTARLQNWIEGSAIAATRGQLHAAQEALIAYWPISRIRALLPGLDADLRVNLKPDDPRLATYTARLADLQNATDRALGASRPQLREFQRAVDTASDDAQANVLSFRNLLAIVGAALVLVLAVIAGLHALNPGFIDLSAGSAGSGQDAVEVWEVMAVGGLGGLLGSVLAIERLGGFSGPFKLPAYQALMRVPMGSGAATAGAVLLQSSLIGALKPQPPLTLLGYCLLFGYAPDVFLRSLDQRVAQVLNQAKTKDDPSAPTSGQPKPVAHLTLVTGGVSPESEEGPPIASVSDTADAKSPSLSPPKSPT